MTTPPDYLLEYAQRLPLQRQAPFMRDWIYFHETLNPNDEILKVMDLMLDLGIGNRLTYEKQNECAELLSALIHVTGSRETRLEAWVTNALRELTAVTAQVRRSAAEAAQAAKAAADEKLPWKKLCWIILLAADLISSGVIAGDAVLLSRIPATTRSAAEDEVTISDLDERLNEYQSAYSKELNTNADLTQRLKKSEAGAAPVEGGFESQRRDYPQQYQ